MSVDETSDACEDSPMILRTQSHVLRRRVRASLFVVALFLFPHALAAEPSLRIVVSIEPYRDVVSRLLPASSQVEVLLPVGASPHGYDPTPRDLTTLAEADLVVMNGGVDAFVLDLVEAIGRGVPLFTVLDHVEVPEAPTEADDHADHAEHADHADPTDHSDHGDHEHHDDRDDHDDHDDHAGGHEGGHEHHDEDHNHGAFGLNPHVWLDPVTVAAVVPELARAVVAVAPDHELEVQANARRLLDELATLDAMLREILAPVEGAVFVPFHDAWPWFADRYGLDLVFEIEPFPGREPSAGELADIVDQLAATGAKAIFAEAQLAARPAEVLADEAGIAWATLDPLGGRPGLLTYEELLVGNARVIAEMLGR